MSSKELTPGARVRFLPPPAPCAYDAGLAGKTGTVIGGPWGSLVRVRCDIDAKVWLTSPVRLEVIPSEHPDVRKTVA